MTPRNLIKLNFCVLFLLLFATGLNPATVLSQHPYMTVQGKSVIATPYRPVKPLSRSAGRTAQKTLWEAVVTHALACRGGRATRLLYKAALRRLREP